MAKFKDFSRPLSVYQVLFKFYFQGLFQTVMYIVVYSSTFQVCANPVYVNQCKLWDTRAVPFLAQGQFFNKLGNGPLGDANLNIKNQVSSPSGFRKGLGKRQAKIKNR